MKDAIFFPKHSIYCFLSRAGRRPPAPCKGATGENTFMEMVSSGSSKKIAGDTRNNWVTTMFVTKNRYHCFSRQSHIDICTQAFHDLEHHGFGFGELGFAEDHILFQVNVPKRYSIQAAETMLKSHSAKRMFEAHPGFRKRYPRGCLLERVRAPRIHRAASLLLISIGIPLKHQILIHRFIFYETSRIKPCHGFFDIVLCLIKFPRASINFSVSGGCSSIYFVLARDKATSSLLFNGHTSDNNPSFFLQSNDTTPSTRQSRCGKLIKSYRKHQVTTSPFEDPELSSPNRKNNHPRI